MQTNVEYGKCGRFDSFLKKAKGRTISVLFDINTKPYASEMIGALVQRGASVITVEYPDKELVPTEDKCDYAFVLSKNADYVLAVGSGTLNDMAKSVSFRRGIPCGILATAASMDGYLSTGAALMKRGFKVTDAVHAPEDLLVDLEIIRNAPHLMTAAGFGDIIGKYTCLADWKLANILLDEPIHQGAYSMMEGALHQCVEAIDGLEKYESGAIEKLMQALITAGSSMALCGNSRPASGSEHHQSHFLEMDFVRRGEKIPMHGLKVAIGTLVSLEIYRYIRNQKVDCPHASEVYALADNLPRPEEVKQLLVRMGCPIRFSELGVRPETVYEMIERAYTVRERFTILTLCHDLDLTEKLKPLIMEKYA